MDHVHKPVSESAEFYLVKVSTKMYDRKSMDSAGLRVDVCGICGAIFSARFVGHFKDVEGDEGR